MTTTIITAAVTIKQARKRQLSLPQALFRQHHHQTTRRVPMPARRLGISFCAWRPPPTQLAACTHLRTLWLKNDVTTTVVLGETYGRLRQAALLAFRSRVYQQLLQQIWSSTFCFAHNTTCLCLQYHYSSLQASLFLKGYYLLIDRHIIINRAWLPSKKI